MRLRRIGDDFLDGCALDFEAEATPDGYALAAALDEGLVGEPAGLLTATSSAVASVGRDLSLARRLRAAGLDVVEVDGWRTRGDAVLTPKAFLTHHTAGAATGNTPSLRIIIEGRSDLRGPLSQVYLGRDRKWYVVASGRANHAGVGSWKGVSGNSNALGVEVEHVGTKLLPPDMVVVLELGVAALCEDRIPAAMNCQHREWSTAGKIDLATNYDTQGEADAYRSKLAARMRELRDVERSVIVFPSSRRRADGAWQRRKVVVPTGRVDEWIAGHPGVLERRGRGSGLEVKPTT